MDLAGETVARLNELAELGNADLVRMFRDLMRSAAASVCLAVIIGPDQEPPLFAIDERLGAGTTPARSSLRIEMIVIDSARHRHRVIFLAAEPGAYAPFTALSLSSFSTSGARLERIVVDSDLDAAAGLDPTGLNSTGPMSSPENRLQRMRTVDQALGFLLDRGLTPAEGRQELRHRAEATGNDLYAQAFLVLHPATLLADQVADRRNPGSASMVGRSAEASNASLSASTDPASG